MRGASWRNHLRVWLTGTAPKLKKHHTEKDCKRERVTDHFISVCVAVILDRSSANYRKRRIIKPSQESSSEIHRIAERKAQQKLRCNAVRRKRTMYPKQANLISIILFFLDLVLDLVVVVVLADLLAQVLRDQAALGRLALGLAHDGHDGRRLGEEHLELLERAAHRLRVEEVDERHDGGGDDGVDDEVPVTDRVDGDGGDLVGAKSVGGSRV